MTPPEKPSLSAANEGQETNELRQTFDAMKQGPEEQIEQKWAEMQGLLEDALSAGGETQAAAERIVSELLIFLNSLETEVGQRAKENIEESLKRSPEVDAFCDMLTALSKAEKAAYLKEHLKVPEIREDQEVCMRGLEEISLFTSELESFVATNQEKPPDHVKRYLKDIQSATKEAYGKVLKSNPAKIADLLPGRIINIFQYPKQFLDGINIKTIDLRNINSRESLTELKVYFAENLRRLKSYNSLAVYTAESFKEELAPIKKEIRDEVEIQVGKIWYQAYILSYKKAKEAVGERRVSEKNTEIEAAAKEIADMQRPVLEAQIGLKKLGEKIAITGTGNFSRDQKALWEVANDAFDLENEWLNFTDENIDHGITAATELTYLAATIIIPELAAAEVTKALGTAAKAILEANRFSSPLAKNLLRVASLGFEASTAIGKYGGNALRVLLSGTVSETTFTAMEVLLGKKDVQNAIEKTPWLKNILINAALSGVFDAIGIHAEKIPESILSTAASGAASRSFIIVVRALIKEGRTMASAYVISSALKGGYIEEGLDSLINALGPEIYELCGKPSL